MNSAVKNPAPLLVLASRSPRRAQLLRDAGYAFVQIDPPFADSADPLDHAAAGNEPVNPQQLAMDLALAKARSLLQSPEIPRISQNGIILGSDTIVVAPDRSLLGQPRDVDDAGRMLETLLDHQHQVVTGVAIMRMAGENSPAELFADTATVTIAHPGAAELNRFLTTGGWRGKAGAYNLAELQAAGQWRVTVVGDPATVVGLPMVKLAQVLPRLGIKPILR